MESLKKKNHRPHAKKVLKLKPEKLLPGNEKGVRARKIASTVHRAHPSRPPSPVKYLSLHKAGFLWILLAPGGFSAKFSQNASLHITGVWNESSGGPFEGSSVQISPPVGRNTVASSLGWSLAGGAAGVLPSILCLGRGSALGLRGGRVEMRRVG